MQTIDVRMLEAEQLWRDGDALVAAGDGVAAYRLYTQAHDLIMDCPSLHERAHRKLQGVSAQHGHRGEIIIDKLLVWLAPLGSAARSRSALRWRIRSMSTSWC